MKNDNAKKTKQQGKAPAWTVGIDLGDQTSQYCVLNRQGERVEEGQVKTRRKELAAFLGQ